MSSANKACLISFYIVAKYFPLARRSLPVGCVFIAWSSWQPRRRTKLWMLHCSLNCPLGWTRILSQLLVLSLRRSEHPPSKSPVFFVHQRSWFRRRTILGRLWARPGWRQQLSRSVWLSRLDLYSTQQGMLKCRGGLDRRQKMTLTL